MAIVELDGFSSPHSKKRTAEELEMLAKAEWRKEYSIERNKAMKALKGHMALQAVGIKKYDFPIETMPNVSTVVKVVKILKDLNERLTVVEKSIASIGEKSIGLMNIMLSRIGKNETKLENIKTELQNKIEFLESG